MCHVSLAVRPVGKGAECLRCFFRRKTGSMQHRAKASAALYKSVRENLLQLRKDEEAWITAGAGEAPAPTLRAALHGLMSAFAADDYARGKQFLDLLHAGVVTESALLMAMRRVASCAVGDYRFVFVRRKFVSRTGQVVESTMSDPLQNNVPDRVQHLIRGLDRFDFLHGECERIIEKVFMTARYHDPEDFRKLDYREHHTFKPISSRFQEEVCGSCFSSIDSVARAMRCVHCDIHVHEGSCHSDTATWSVCAPPHKTSISPRQHARNYRWETVTKLVVYSFRKHDGAFAVLPKDLVKYLLAMI